MPLVVAGLAIPTSVGLINLVAQQTRDEHLRAEHRHDARARPRDRLLPVPHQPLPRGAGARPDRRAGGGARCRHGRQGRPVLRASPSRSGCPACCGSRRAALSSIGLGGAIVVLASVFYSLTFLPAFLGMLGPRVNALSVGGLLRRLGLRRDTAGRRAPLPLGAGRARGHAPPDRGARPGPRLPAAHRLAVPAAEAGRPRRDGQPRRRPEPRRLGRAPGGVPRGRDDADRHPRSTRPRARRTSATITAVTAPVRAPRRARRHRSRRGPVRR